jgi:predicted TIM-barrel enzyme
VKDALPDTPVFANTGVNINNVTDVLKIADGCVIGSHLKVDGNTWNSVDKARVKRFMDKVRKIR